MKNKERHDNRRDAKLCLHMSEYKLNKNFVLGVDIGGSHITLALIDLSSRSIVENFVLRKRIDPHAEAELILESWCDLIRECWQKFQLAGTRIGFAMPGPFDYGDGICLIKGFDKYESLYEVNIRSELSRRLNIPGIDIAFRNDAEAFLEGEIYFGAARGYNHVIGLTIGTGMGSAYSHDGVTADAELSVANYAGEIIEEFVSTRGLVRLYQAHTGRIVKDAMELAKLCKEDPYAIQAFKEFAGYLAWLLNQFIIREKPEIVVIGGNIANSWDLFMGEVHEKLILSLPYVPKIVKTVIGENAALIGGVCCFNDVREKFANHMTIN